MIGCGDRGRWFSRQRAKILSVNVLGGKMEDTYGVGDHGGKNYMASIKLHTLSSRPGILPGRCA